MLVTGADGMLGSALRRRFAGGDAPAGGVIWTDVAELDITDAAAVTALVRRHRPGVIVNCAAYTDVDGCESHEEATVGVNVRGVGNLAAAATEADSLLVQISTDFVFSGEADRPYREDDATGPLCVYGRTKLEGERLAVTAARHLIVRTAWLYGPGGRNFVRTICDRLARGVPLRVVGDQVGCPTYTGDLADAVLALLAAGAGGVYHACGGASASWHEFAEAIAELFKPGTRIEKITGEELRRPARRPVYSVLDCSKLAKTTGRRLPGFRDALPRYLAELSGELTEGH